MPEYEMLDEGSRNMEDLDSDASLDEELRTQFFKIPGVEREMNDANKKLEDGIESKKLLKDMVIIHTWLCIMHICLKWYKYLIQIVLKKQKLRRNG